MDISVRTKIQLNNAAFLFIRELESNDLLDHPDVFKMLDDALRTKAFMIVAQQQGVFGTVLKIGRISEYEG